MFKKPRPGPLTQKRTKQNQRVFCQKRLPPKGIPQNWPAVNRNATIALKKETRLECYAGEVCFQTHHLKGNLGKIGNYYTKACLRFFDSIFRCFVESPVCLSKSFFKLVFLPCFVILTVFNQKCNQSPLNWLEIIQKAWKLTANLYTCCSLVGSVLIDYQ